jgi:hypothetical protein
MIAVWVWLNWPWLGVNGRYRPFWRWYRSDDRANALAVAFDWNSTRQGRDFWLNIARRYGLDW